METPDHILQRLQKLLRKAESAKKTGSVAEAEAFAMKAQEIMAEYNLSMQDVSLEDKPKMGDIQMDAKDIFPKNQGTWIRDLYHTIAYYNYCRAINFVVDLADLYPEEYAKLNDNYGTKSWADLYDKFYDKKGEDRTITTIRLIGEAHNVEMTKYIVDQLINKAKPLARHAWKAYQDNPPRFDVMEKKGQYLRGFLSGFVTGISIKLAANKKRMETDKPELTTMALVLRDQVDDYYKEKFKTADKKIRSGGTKSEHGQEEGIKKGLETDINKGLGTNDLNQKLLN